MKLMVRRNNIYLLILIFVLLNSTVSYTQDQKYPRGAQYFLGTDDQLLIRVNIWGFVAKPGQYMVPSDTDLISLISFSGGPIEGAKLSNIKLIRTDNSNNSKKKIISIDVKKYTKNGEESLIPKLQPNDTIIVSGSKWHHLGNFLGFVTKIATIAQIYWWILYLNR